MFWAIVPGAGSGLEDLMTIVEKVKRSGWGLGSVLPALLRLLAGLDGGGRTASMPSAPTSRLQILRWADHRAPHMRDRAVVEAEPFLWLAEVAADHVGEFLQLDMHIGVER